MLRNDYVLPWNEALRLSGAPIKDTSTYDPSKPTSVPLFRGILPISRVQVPLDIVAGLTFAATAMPETMGYTKIAGTPIVTGLYTLVVPLALFACFGSSRHLCVEADSATASVLGASLIGIVAVGTPEYLAYAGLLALITGVFLILARLVKLGFLADFLSRTVLVGFLTGVGLQVGVAQIPGMLGIPGHPGLSNPIGGLVSDFHHLPQANPYAFAMAIGVIAAVLGMRRFSKRIPGQLLALVGAIIVSYGFNLASSRNIAILGTVPGGLPQLILPQVNLNGGILLSLIPIAFTMFIVILAQSSATARAYAARYNERLDQNRDLVGLGIANIGGALSGTFVVNGSPTMSQVVNSAGGRSQIAQLTAVTVVVAVLLFLTGPLAYLPIAALSAIVFLIAKDLLDISGMRRIFAQRRSEFWVALITSATVFFVGVQQGIFLAIFLSLLDHVRRGYRPKNSVLSFSESGEIGVVPVVSHAQFLPGLIVYRFNHSMYYANSDLFSAEVQELVSTASPSLIWFCLDLDAVDDIDFSAAAALRTVYDTLKQRKIRLVLTEVEDNIGIALDRYGITELIGIENIFKTVNGVVTAFERIESEVQGLKGS